MQHLEAASGRHLSTVDTTVKINGEQLLPAAMFNTVLQLYSVFTPYLLYPYIKCYIEMEILHLICENLQLAFIITFRDKTSFVFEDFGVQNVQCLV